MADLQELAENAVGSIAPPLGALDQWPRWLQTADPRNSLVAGTLFWDIVTNEPARDRSPSLARDASSFQFVTPIGNGATTLTRFSERSVDIGVERFDLPGRDELQESLDRWKRSLDAMGLTSTPQSPDFFTRRVIAPEVTVDALYHLAEESPMYVIDVPKPAMVTTSSVSPPFASGLTRSDPQATGGLWLDSNAPFFVEAGPSGRRPGVIVPYHLFDDCGVTPNVGTEVWLDDQRAHVVAFDQITDSCLVAPPTPPARSPGSSRPLDGVTPRMNEQATFDRPDGSSVHTTVTSWSPTILTHLSALQAVVLTKPCTKGGDSGALLTSCVEGYELGVSFCRTGIEEPIEFSAWIWAASIYRAYGALT